MKNSKAQISFDGRKVLILGDSITDGGTYASLLIHLLGRLAPSWRINRLVSVGVSSETCSGLSEPKHPFPRPCVHERLERALAKFKPDVLFACYGMNDGIYNPQSPERFQAYKDGVAKIVSAAKAAGVERMFLMTPPPFDPAPVAKQVLPLSAGHAEFSYANPYEGYASVVVDYAKWIMSLKDPFLTLVDLNSALRAALAEGRKADPAFALSADGIHPGFLGHLIIASEILKALGFRLDGSLASLASELEREPAFKAVDERRKLLSDAWKEYIGYTREKTFSRASIDDVLKTCGW